SRPTRDHLRATPKAPRKLHSPRELQPLRAHNHHLRAGRRSCTSEAQPDHRAGTEPNNPGKPLSALERLNVCRLINLSGAWRPQTRETIVSGPRRRAFYYWMSWFFLTARGLAA